MDWNQARRKLYRLHRWLGIHLGLLTFVICLSGTLASLGHEWDWLFDDAWRAETETMDWHAASESLQRGLPDHRITHVFAPPVDGMSAHAYALSPTGQTHLALFEPETGEIQGLRNLVNVQVYLRQFHKGLLVPWSLYLLGLLGFLLVFSGISGLIIYRRWWKNLLRLRFDRSRQILWSDVHRTLGVWLSLFALVIGVTSIWYQAEMIGYNFHLDAQPHRAELERNTQGAGKSSIVSIGEMVDAAIEAMPEDFEVRSIHMPEHLGDSARVDGQTDALFVRDRANQAHVDPYTGEVLETHLAGDGGILTRWSNMADELHFGTLGNLGGLWSRILYFVLGLGLTLVVLAGSLLSLFRHRPPRDDDPRASFARFIPTILTLALLAGSIFFTYLGLGMPMITGLSQADAVGTAAIDGQPIIEIARHEEPEDATYMMRWSGDAAAEGIVGAKVHFDESYSRDVDEWMRPMVEGAPSGENVTFEFEMRDSRRVEVPVSLAAAPEKEGWAELNIGPGLYVWIYVSLLLLLVVLTSVVWVGAILRPLLRDPN